MTDQLHAAAAAYRAALPAGSLTEFRIDGFDAARPGVPVAVASHVPPGGPYKNGMGYGATPVEATVGALGELVEAVLLREAARDWTFDHGTYPDMVNRHGTAAVLDPVSFCLPVGLSDIDQRPFAWTAVESLDGVRRAWAPAAFVVSSNESLPPGTVPVTNAITNGCGAGDTADRAIAHALCELMQRDGNTLSFRALDRGIEVTDWPKTERLRTILEACDRSGIRMLVKYAGTSCGVVSLYALPIDEGHLAPPITLSACGEAADPDPAKAVEKAILESLAARARKVFTHIADMVPGVAVPEDDRRGQRLVDPGKEELEAMRAMDRFTRLAHEEMADALRPTVHRTQSKIPFDTLPRSAGNDDPRARLSLLRRKIEAEGLTVWTRTVRRGGAVAAKAVVPGMEMEFPNFLRLGERGARTLIERDDPMVHRTPREGRRRVVLRPEAEERLGGPVHIDVALLQERVAPLYALYREPATGALAKWRELRM